MKKHYTIDNNRLYIILGNSNIYPKVCIGEQVLKEYDLVTQLDDSCKIYEIEMIKEMPYTVDLNEV